MGFSDSFKKAFGQLSGFTLLVPQSSKEARAGIRGMGSMAITGNPFAPASALLGERFKGSGGNNRTQRTILGLSAPGVTAGERYLDPRENEKLRDKFRSFTQGEKTDAPAVGKAERQNTKTIAAKRQARDLAVQQAEGRRGLGLGGTIRTSPLGLQGDGATTTRRRLIGE